MGAILLSPIYILVNAYVVWWLLQYLDAWNPMFQYLPIKVLIIVLYSLVATTLLSCFLIRKDPWHRRLKVVSNYWLGMFAYILMTILGFDLVRRIVRKFHLLPEEWFQTRGLFLLVGGIVVLIICICGIYGMTHAQTIVVDHRELIVKKACKQSELTIALTADWHLGYSVGEKKMYEMVKLINREKVDLICIAGDQFDNNYDAIRHPKRIASILRGMKSKYGTYAVFGNHDMSETILAGFTFETEHEEKHDPRFDEFLEKSNIQLLQEDVICIEDSFYLAGREDPQRAKKLGAKRKTPEQLLEGVDKEKPIFVIDHQPKELNELEQAGVDIDLSGHTHNGQIFPGNIFTSLFWKNSDGILKVGKMYSCVTSGIGIWGPDMRIGTDSEIMILHIKFQQEEREESENA